jgi:hypothetical protein
VWPFVSIKPKNIPISPVLNIRYMFACYFVRDETLSEIEIETLSEI